MIRRVHVLDRHERVAHTGVCRACGPVQLRRRGLSWICPTSYRQIEEKQKARKLLPSKLPLTFPIPVRRDATPIVIGAQVRLSDEYRLHRDDHTQKYEKLVGTVTGTSRLYPGMWEVQYAEDKDHDMRHSYCESWLAVVDPKAEPPAPQKLLHLVRGEL